MVKTGGQRRTIETRCGWRCDGHPREVNGKHKIHIKFCDICKNDKLPDFNKSITNGWKGVASGGIGINKNYTTTCVTNDMEINIRLNAKSVNDALNKVKENKN